MHLDRTVDDLLQHFGPPELELRDFHPRPRCTFRVPHPSGMQRQQAQRPDLDGRVGNHLLDHLLLPEQLALRRSRHRALAHHLEGAVALAHPPHGVVNTATIEPLLREDEPVALRADAILDRHSTVLEEDLGVTTGAEVARVRMVHVVNVAGDVQARRPFGNDDHRRRLVGRVVRVGHDHHQDEVGDGRVRREPFVPVDHVLVTVAYGDGLDHRRVTARVVRLGHREARRDLTAQQWFEPLLALCRSGADGDQFAVARIGRLIAKDVRRRPRTTQDLVHQGQLHLAVPLTTELVVEMARPEAALLHFLFQRSGEFAPTARRHVVEEQLDGLDLIGDELAHPVELCLELRFGREIPCHRGPLARHLVLALPAPRAARARTPRSNSRPRIVLGHATPRRGRVCATRSRMRERSARHPRPTRDRGRRRSRGSTG